MSVTVPRGFRFEQTIPYETPGSLDELHGPTSGTVRVRPHINTSPDPVYDLASPSQVWSLYSAVVRDGLPSEQSALLDRNILVALWTELNLPMRCRAIWEEKFPELAAVSPAKAV